MKLPELGVDNPVFVKIILLLIFVLGIRSFLTLPRYMDPDVNMNFVSVLTFHPGLAPDDMETLVTSKLEEELEELDDIDRMMSRTRESVSSIQIEFDQTVDDMDIKVTKVHNAVNQVDDLPDDTETPRVIEITTAFWPICEIAVSAGLPYGELKEIAELLSDRIEDIEGVGEAHIFGNRPREIWIEVDKQKMEAYGLSLQEINDAVRLRNQNVPGGNLDLGKQSFNLRVIGEYEEPKALGEIVLRSRPDGGTVFLRDIATINDTHAEAVVSVEEGSKPCLLLQVRRKKNSDTVRILEEIKVFLPQFKQEIGSEIRFTIFNDTSVEIRERISDLQTNALLGLILVFIILAYALGGRNAIFAGFGIPVSFFFAFILMDWFDLSLNGVSLFAMILVLGIVVDDAIIVLENIRRHMEMGKSPRAAAVDGVMEVTLPITSATFTTIAAFAPLMLVTGIMGKFIQEIPLIVIFTLAASILEAFFMMPSHVSEFGRLSISKKQNHKKWDIFDWLRPKLSQSLFYILRHRYIVVPTLLLILATGSFWTWYVIQVEMFPSSDVFPRFDVKVWLAEGTRLEETEEKMREITEELLEIIPQEVLKTTVNIAGMVEVEYQPEYAPHVGTIEVLLYDDYAEYVSIPNLMERVRKQMPTVPGLRSYQLDRKKEGPPTGAPIYLEVRGEEWDNLEAVAERLKEYLFTVKGVYDIRDDYSRDRRELWIELDEPKAKMLGISHAMLADTIHTAIQGKEISQFHEAEEEIDIFVKVQEQYRSKIDDVRNLKVKTINREYVTVDDVADIQIKPGFYAIRHTDAKRTIIVSAQIDNTITTSQTANDQIRKNIPRFTTGYPETKIAFGGEYKRNQETFDSIFMSFILSIFLIYLILGTQFKSFMQPLVIMTVVPFASVGVFGGLLLTGNRFTFPAMIGIVALAGIVVNDSLVLVEFINRHRRRNHNIFSSIVRACKLRLRPIVLTSVTTIGGLIPMALGIGGKSPLWSPLANAIIFGLTTSTFLTLFIVPLVYVIAEDVKRVFAKLLS